MAVKALTSFSCNIYKEHGTNQFVEFQKGDVVVELDVIDTLVKSNCPVAPVKDTEMVSCPKCRTCFKSSEHPVQATITRVNCALPYESQFYKWSAGEVVRYPWLAEALDKAGIPLAIVDGVECPKCQTIFY